MIDARPLALALFFMDLLSAAQRLLAAGHVHEPIDPHTFVEQLAGFMSPRR